MEERFDLFVEEWLATQSVRLRPTTHAGYAAIVTRYLLPAFGHMHLNELSSRDIHRLYAGLLTQRGRRGRPLSPRTVRQVHAVLRAALGAAVLQGVIDRNPAWGAAIPRDDCQQFEPTLWSPDDAVAFLRLIDDHPLVGLFQLALGSGMRRGELLGLTPEDVEGNKVTVRWAMIEVAGRVGRSRPKSRKPRVLTIDDDTALRLERQRLRELVKADQGLPWKPFFSDADGGFIRPSVVTHTFRKLIRGSNLPRIRFHDLRHTHATLLLAAGVPVHVVSTRLGHTPAATLRYYAHVLPASDAAAAATYNAMITTGTAPVSRPKPGTWIEASASPFRDVWPWQKDAGHRNSISSSEKRT